MSKYFRWFDVLLILFILLFILVFGQPYFQDISLSQSVAFGIYLLLFTVLFVYILKLKLTHLYRGFCLIFLGIIFSFISTFWAHLSWLHLLSYCVLKPAGILFIILELIQVSRKQYWFVQQLDASEDRFRLIFENAKDAIFIERVDGKILDVNPAACDLFGYTKEEFLRLSVHDIVPSEIHQVIPDLNSTVKPNGKFYLSEVLNLTKSGRKFPVEISANRIKIKGNEVVIAIVRDISERKRNEQSILIRNERLQLFNRISLLIHEYHEPGPLIQAVAREMAHWLNGNAYLAFLPEESVAEMVLIQQQHFPEDFPKKISFIKLKKLFRGDLTKARLFSDLTSPELQLKIGNFKMAKSLSEAGIDSLILLPFYSQERLIALVGVGNLKRKLQEPDLILLQTVGDHVAVAIENITLYHETRDWALELESRVKQRTLELEKSEKRFRQMVECIKDGYFTIDQNLMLTYWNDGAESTTGLSREAVLNKHLFEVWPGLRRTEVLEKIKEVNETGEFRSLQSYYQDENIAAWFSIRFYPWEQGVAVFYNNISEQKQAEAALKEANEDLKSFAYSVSHDLRGPLRAIDGFAKMLADELPKDLNETLWHYLDRIRNGAQNLNYLINDLLVFSRVTRQEPRRYEVKVLEVVEKLIQEVKEIEPDNKVDFQIKILPTVKSDVHLLEILLRNLISNAVKFSRFRENPVIEFGSKQEGGKSIIYVKDNGIGFEMKYHDRIFGVFQRLHQPEAYEGTGIGLATVKRIVEKYGGKIWAESAEDAGATFFFYLQ